MPRHFETKDPDFAEEFSAFMMERLAAVEDVDTSVAAILADVRNRGDAALVDYTLRFDRSTLTSETLRIPATEIAGARAKCTSESIAALERAAERIVDFHHRQVPEDIDYRDTEGVRLGARWTPISAIGIYVPGGTAAYPSSVLMNALPARVAGVERLVMTVPAPDDVLSPLVLAAADIVGVDEIYRVGGAQAIAALAYGTETIEAVDKIAGPGNAYVTAAKRQVFGTVGIDMIAGPSEILVVADADNDPAWIAADLLSQAEHDIAAQAILITDNAAFADAVVVAVAEHLRDLPRREIADASWKRQGAVIVVSDFSEVPALVDRLAPEHLELAVADPDGLAAKIRHAGAIFLGRYTPEAIGDYVAGPNHVLPTARSARFSSGLGVLDFLKRTSIISCDEESLGAIGPTALTLAHAEGLDAHALSIAIRLNRRRGSA